MTSMFCPSVKARRVLHMVVLSAACWLRTLSILLFLVQRWNQAEFVLYNTTVSLCNEQHLRRRRQGEQSHLPFANPSMLCQCTCRELWGLILEERLLIMFHCVDDTGPFQDRLHWKKSLLCFVSRFYPRSPRDEGWLSSCLAEPLPFTFTCFEKFDPLRQRHEIFKGSSQWSVIQ